MFLFTDGNIVRLPSTARGTETAALLGEMPGPADETASCL